MPEQTHGAAWSIRNAKAFTVCYVYHALKMVFTNKSNLEKNHKKMRNNFLA